MGESFDIHVTNIDVNLGDWKTIRHAINCAFGEHVKVLAVWVCTPKDGSVSAIVRVGSIEEGRYAVSQLHRKKLGSKRIFISFNEASNFDSETLKREVASLLQDVPNCSVPLFKFRDMFEKRYRRSISSSDLYRMKDVVVISDNSPTHSNSGFVKAGRTISLLPDWQSKDDKDLNLYCQLHPPNTSLSRNVGWAEKQMAVTLPNVICCLKTFSNNLHRILQVHDGTLPLLSFIDCYESEFGELRQVDETEGVPVEHLICCVNGVEVTCPDNEIKKVQWMERKTLDGNGNSLQPLATQLSQLSRELMELLKTFPRCSIPFSKLIPAYHHHFGKQFRVADYGHFSLSGLLKTLPNTIQILDSAQNKVITLSHKAQIKRFGSDLMRVLKSHGGAKKQIRTDEFADLYAQAFSGKEFQPEDYGLCFFADLVQELVDKSSVIVVLKDDEGSTIIAVPKREQTPYEINKTRVFATEVIELLRHSNHCQMPFSKFIPAYHHHFGRQCRVSEYGFSKLAELFEAISDTVVTFNVNSMIESSSEDKIIRLTPKEQLKVVGDQICNIIEKRSNMNVPTLANEMEKLYLKEYGFQLRADFCGATNTMDLLNEFLTNLLKIENGQLYLVDRIHIDEVKDNIKSILKEKENYKMEFEDFLVTYLKCFNQEFKKLWIARYLSGVVEIQSDFQEKEGLSAPAVTIALSPHFAFSMEIADLLESHGGNILWSNLESAYLKMYNKAIPFAHLGFTMLSTLIESIPEIGTIRGKNRQKCLVANNFRPHANKRTVHDNFGVDSNNLNNKFFKQNNYKTKPWKDKDTMKIGTEHSTTNKEDPAANVKRKLNLGNRRGSLPPPLYPPSLPSPVFSPSRNTEAPAFSFEQSTSAISSSVYEMFMHESVVPGSPNVSPPVIWTYHPVIYPRAAPTPTPHNPTLMYSFSAPWSPPTMPQIPQNNFEHLITQPQHAIPTANYVPDVNGIYNQVGSITNRFESFNVAIKPET